MVKAIAFVLVCLLGASAQAQQSGAVRDLSQDVNELVQDNIDSLPPRDRQEVRYSLNQVLRTFERNGFRAGGYRPRAGNLICDSSDNTLRDLDDNGKLIHDFGDAASCAQAKEYVSRGEPYCDFADNKLFSAPGNMIHDFGDSDSCKVARVAVIRGGNFCDYSDNTLRNRDGKLIYDFGSKEDCDNGLRQAR